MGKSRSTLTRNTLKIEAAKKLFKKAGNPDTFLKGCLSSSLKLDNVDDAILPSLTLTTEPKPNPLLY